MSVSDNKAGGVGGRGRRVMGATYLGPGGAERGRGSKLLQSDPAQEQRKDFPEEKRKNTGVFLFFVFARKETLPSLRGSVLFL